MNAIACAIHGGAGALARDKYSASDIHESMAVMQRLLLEARQALSNGAFACEVAVNIVAQLEDHPIFNAGRGSVLNADGVAEMDASVMDTREQIAAGVTGLKTVRHPILCALELARLKGHTLLAGEGAERFARQHRLETCDPNWFVTATRKKDHDEFLISKKIKLEHGGSTVGACVRDRHGNLAAATSTGGLTGKAPGRVSDSSIIGAGTWADTTTLATSGTGTGDVFIRLALGHQLHALMKYQGMNIEAAHQQALDMLKSGGGIGGFASVSARGEVCLPYNSGGMFRAGFGVNRTPYVAIWDEEINCPV